MSVNFYSLDCTMMVLSMAILRLGILRAIAVQRLGTGRSWKWGLD